ncbi:hypothetical protein JY97_09990 [Alkalispirochaeta odontotermitis]|nr:hypothetical protein JY97_09990 [Alkalispirochaeta odontotermitis]
MSINMSIPVFKPSIKRRDMHSVLSCLLTDEIGPSTLADKLTELASDYFKLKGGLALREYSRAVWLSINALKLEENDEVIISPLAPLIYLKTIISQGIKPIFVDVGEEDACLDSSAVAEKMTTAVKAIFVHAPLGRIPPDLSQFEMPIVLDLSESIGIADSRGMPIASGTYIILAMEPRAIVTCGGGTLVLAHDESSLTHLNNIAKSLSEDSLLSDLNASLGLVQWEELPFALETRDKIYHIFFESLRKGHHRTLRRDDESYRTVAFSFPVILSTAVRTVSNYARKMGVETRRAFLDTIIEAYPEVQDHCPKAKRLAMSTILFPLYPTLGKKSVQLISKVLSTLP